MNFPLSKNGLKYGFLYWPSKADTLFNDLIGGYEKINVNFQGRMIEGCIINRKYRKLFLRVNNTRQLANVKEKLNVYFSLINETLIIEVK